MRACGLGVLRPRRDRRRPPCRCPVLGHRPHRTPRSDAAIASIPEDAWTTIRYPRAVFDEQLQQWVCDAEVAEIRSPRSPPAAASTRVTARLIVRRVRDANPDHVIANAQGELFPAWRHHAVFTDSPLTMLQAEADHRRHAIVEQVIADLKNGPLAHLPSGRFTANGAWLVLAAIAFNLHPRRRRARLAVPRQGYHRHDPRTADQRPRPVVRSARRVTCACQPTGPGRPPGTTCSPPRSDHQPRLTPDRPPHRPDRRSRGNAEQTGGCTHARHRIQQHKINKSGEFSIGGSGLICEGVLSSGQAEFGPVWGSGRGFPFPDRCPLGRRPEPCVKAGRRPPRRGLALMPARTTSRCAGCVGMGRTVGSRPRSACRWTTRGRG